MGWLPGNGRRWPLYSEQNQFQSRWMETEWQLEALTLSNAFLHTHTAHGHNHVHNSSLLILLRSMLILAWNSYMLAHLKTNILASNLEVQVGVELLWSDQKHLIVRSWYRPHTVSNGQITISWLSIQQGVQRGSGFTIIAGIKCSSHISRYEWCQGITHNKSCDNSSTSVTTNPEWECFLVIWKHSHRVQSAIQPLKHEWVFSLMHYIFIMNNDFSSACTYITVWGPRCDFMCK